MESNDLGAAHAGASSSPENVQPGIPRCVHGISAFMPLYRVPMCPATLTLPGPSSNVAKFGHGTCAKGEAE